MAFSGGPHSQGYRWKLVALLSLSVFVNYVDRGNLPVSAPAMVKELSLSPTQLGLLFSAFFWTYAIGQIPAGWLVDRFRVDRLYAAAYLLWCVATLLTGFTGTLGAFLVLRLLLGLGESVVYPACSQLVIRNFAEHERGRANALIDVGTKIGPMLGTLLGGLLIAYWGWRMLFIAAGTIGLLWLIPWHLSVSEPNPQAHLQGHAGPSMFDILKRRDMIGTSLGLFCYGYVWYFLLSWLPSYLVTERHLSIRAMALFGSLPFLASGLSALISGWLSDRMIAHGSTPTRVRKGFVVTGLLLCTLMLPAAVVESVPAAIALLTAACCAIGLFSSNVWATTQTLAGPLAAGKWSGMQNAAGNLGGVASPLLTGFIVSSTHSFFLAFVCATIALLVGAAAYLFVVGDIAPLTWEPRKNTVLADT